jgi:hypothetical protein
MLCVMQLQADEQQRKSNTAEHHQLAEKFTRSLVA